MSAVLGLSQAQSRRVDKSEVEMVTVVQYARDARVKIAVSDLPSRGVL